MRKLAILSLVLGLTFSLMSKTFADVPPICPVPSAKEMIEMEKIVVALNQFELERVKKLAEERIRQGKNSGIFEKAVEIAIFESNRGRENNDLYCDYREDRKMRKSGLGTYIEITVIVFYKNEEVFLAIKKTYPSGLFDMKIEIYRPGGWEAELKSLYKKVQETKRTQEIQDLKSRFGIK